MSEIVIERPKTNDIFKIKQLFTVSITNAFIKEGLGHLTEDIANDIREKITKLENYFLDNSRIIFLIAKVNEEIVGTISYGPINNDIRKLTNNEFNHIGELGSIYILPEYENQGIASKLIKEMIKILENMGVTTFCLDCGLKRAQQKWLKKFGTPYKIFEDYWGKGNPHMIWLCQVADFKGD
ncbi:MAG: GNAT family N-acetyltransferase [Bacilli bacterium]|nr:GNAT family N-acetyltransferase [Bacilli bacterium]